MNSRRTARTRAATNENGDENRTAATTRLTRAKAASLSSEQATITTRQTKTTTTTTAAPVNTRKRSALGDVSNVHKIEAAGGAAGEKKAGKKVIAKTVTATKASTSTKVPTATTGATKTTRGRPTVKASASSQDIKRKSAVETQTETQVTRKKRPAPTIRKDEDTEEEDRDVSTAIKGAIIEEENVEVDENSRASKRPRTDKIKPEAQPASASATPGWDDLDAEDVDDPLMVSEYVNEIFEYLKQLEPDTQPNPDYMDNQEDLQWKMRGILIDWLIEVHTRFRLLPETLFLAVNVVDRFLSNKVVLLDKLQLVGVAAMFVAAKYEEVFSPHVQYFRHVADDGFTEEEILRAERFILATLDYNLSYPNPMNFLRRISKADQYDFQTRTFAKYLMEISLLDHRFMQYLPSHVAAASMYMSRMMLNRGEWDANLVHFSDYTEEQILPVFRLMLDYLIRPVKHEAFYKKYASKKFMKASLHARQWAKRNAKAHGVVLDETDLYDED